MSMTNDQVHAVRELGEAVRDLYDVAGYTARELGHVLAALEDIAEVPFRDVPAVIAAAAARCRRVRDLAADVRARYG